ncbi:MAG: phosphotransferase [Candidatus Micrarchaeaceae archaeon]
MNEFEEFNAIKAPLSKEDIAPIKKLKSTTNDVILCKNNDGRLSIVKIYNNKYFPKQAEYEKLIYLYLHKYNFRNIPKIYKSVTRSTSKNYNVFEYIPYKNLAQYKTPQIEKLLPKIISMFNKLHAIPIPKTLIKMHPQEQSACPVNFLSSNTISKLKNIYKPFRLQKYLNLKPVTSKTVFSHRDPDYKHIITNSENLYLVDFEDAGAFPIEVDYASLLKDMIEYKESLHTILMYLKQLNETVDDIWPYLIRIYLIDYAYASNSTFLNFYKFQEIVETEDPSNGLQLLVKSHETGSNNW